MLTITKSLLFGFILGTYFSFVTYYLLSPSSGTNLVQILFWGGQGALFASTYKIITICFRKISLSGFLKHYWSTNIITGSLCGLILAVLNIYINYKTITSSDGGVMSTEFRGVLINDLLHIGLGFLLIGIGVGISMGYLDKLKSRVETRESGSGHTN